MQGSRRNDLLAQSAQGCELSVPWHATSPIAAAMLLHGCLEPGVWEAGNHDGKQQRGECLCPESIKLNLKEHPMY